RHVWANVGAWNLIGWWHTLVELWAWDRPQSRSCDRSDSPWDRAERRPSHADRCRELRREAMQEEYSSLPSLSGVRPKIRRFIRRLMRRVAWGWHFWESATREIPDDKKPCTTLASDPIIPKHLSDGAEVVT